MKIDFFASGYCEANQYVVNPNAGFKPTKFYAVWALLELPLIGYLLFDTGYSEAFHEVTKNYPEKLYKHATPITLNKGESALEILAKKGIQAKDIAYIVLSHFHADHVAGLIDFPAAKIICSKKAFQQTQDLSGFSAVKKGILKKLIPKDIEHRILFVEEFANAIQINKYGIEEYQLFKQKTFTLLSLPGHACGMLGFVWNQESKKIVYASDAAWDYSCLMNGIMPSKLVKIFIDSWTDLASTMQKLRTWKQQEKDSLLLFTHCPTTLKYCENVI